MLTLTRIQELADVGEFVLAEGLLGRPTGHPEYLYAAGRIKAGLGACKQIDSLFEEAKDLFTRSARLFRQRDDPRYYDVLCDLALCYWRQGSYDEGIAAIQVVLEGSDDPRSMFRALLSRSVIESESGQPEKALRTLEQANSFPVDQNLEGKLHGQRAKVFKQLFDQTSDVELRDRAFSEYEAANYCFEQFGNQNGLTIVLNNHASLYASCGMFSEAHESVDRAIRMWTEQDYSQLAVAKEQKAQIYLSENQAEMAVIWAQQAVRLLEGGSLPRWLDECRKTLYRANRALEVQQIRNALEASHGSVSKAAEILGIPRQTLAFRIQKFYPELQSARNPRRVRRWKCKPYKLRQ